MNKRLRYQREIIEYYTASNWLYKYVWAWGGSRGLHFGFADSTKRSHNEALLNQYRFVVRKGKINKSSRVLDAGCGVGGAVVYIARETGAWTVGISLVPKQVADATAYAEKVGVAARTKFVVGDYTKTGLEQASFDVVFGMESVCYANPQHEFLREAYRLLKPGGILILTDGYRKRAVEKAERDLMKRFLNGWKLETLAENNEMRRNLKIAGFEKIVEEDVTEKTQMSISRMQRIVWMWEKIGEPVVGWIQIPIVEAARDNAQAMKAWIEGVERGLFGYYAHVAQKPK